MKVVITINTAWNIYNFRRGLIKALQDEGIEVIAVSPKDEYSAMVKSLGCKHYPIKMENKGTNPFNDYKLYRTLLKVYERIQPDFILHYTIKPNIYGTLAAKKLGIPVINNVSGLGTIFLHNHPLYKVARSLYKIAFKHPKKVFFQNCDDLKLFLDYGLIKKEITAVLPGSGVNINELIYHEVNKKSSFTFLMLARVLYDKGVQEYVEASNILKAKGYEFEAQLAGSLDELSNMGVPKSTVLDWHNKGLINYLGEVNKVSELIINSQCVVLPSYREGTPKSLLEAGAIGRPIIATNVPGCREVVIHNENGYLCEAKNPNSLADMMGKMLDANENTLKRLGARSRKLIEEKFDERIVIGKYLEVIKSL